MLVSYTNGARAVSAPGGSSVSRLVRSESKNGRSEPADALAGRQPSGSARAGRRYPGPTAHAALSATRASGRTRRMSVALHGDGSRLPDPRGRAAAEQAALAQAPNRREKHGNEEHADRGRDEHPEEHACSDRVAARRSGAARRQERRDAQNECERGHENRPQPPAARLQRRPPGGAPPGPPPVPRPHRPGSLLRPPA